MAKQVIGVGTSANDGNGDNLRDAFIKVNDNFTELYDDDAGDVGSIIAGTGISVDQATGNVTVTNSAPDQTVALTGEQVSVQAEHTQTLQSQMILPMQHTQEMLQVQQH